MNKTKIEWCDYTWNPITGCLEGCFYCYARKMYNRFNKDFTPQFHNDRLEQPVKCKKPSRIFVCSVSDFWGKGVPQTWRNEVYKIFTRCPRHTFLILTKQPQRICDQKRIPQNTWVGVSVSTEQDWWRPATLCSKLPKTQKTFISIEPLIEQSDYVSSYFFLAKWIIVGAMTGPGSKKHAPNPRAVRYIIATARRCMVPLFLKNNLQWKEKMQEFPDA